MKIQLQIMETLTKSTLLLFLFCIIYSCSNKDEKDTLLLIINEKETASPNAQLVIEEDLGQYFDIQITDSVIFLITTRGESAIKAFSTKDYSLIDEFGNKGDGPEGVDFPIYIKTTSNIEKVELYDINYKSLIKIDFDTKRNTYTLKKEQMPDALWPPFNVNRVSDSIFFANALSPFNKGLYFKLNTKTSEKEWIPYLPEYKTDEEDKTVIYLNTILVNDEKSIVVCAMKYFNRIFTFDFDGNLIKDMQIGQSLLEPIVENLELGKFSKDSDMFFLNMVGNKTHFYCLYNRDRINVDNRKGNNSKILVFDWNLNHVSTIQTEHVISAMDVAPNNKYLLALVFDEEEDTRVYKYDIELP